MSAAPGLTLLCDEALGADPPRRSPTCVRFLDTDLVYVIESPAVILSDDPEDGWVPRSTPVADAAEQQYEQWLDACIQQAGFNRERNRPVRRYGEPSPITTHKRRRECNAATDPHTQQRESAALVRAALVAGKEAQEAQGHAPVPAGGNSRVCGPEPRSRELP